MTSDFTRWVEDTTCLPCAAGCLSTTTTTTGGGIDRGEGVGSAVTGGGTDTSRRRLGEGHVGGGGVEVYPLYEFKAKFWFVRLEVDIDIEASLTVRGELRKIVPESIQATEPIAHGLCWADTECLHGK